MNTLFSNNNLKKVKVIEIYTRLFEFLSTFIRQIKRFLLIVQQKKGCKLEFVTHLLLPFSSSISVRHCSFLIIIFMIYNILVTKWTHGIGHIDIFYSMKNYRLFQHQL